ncbi:hypothetical protein K1719_007741 [Acacia pycnantha]|nr:hypothetical protein K1719_007741 [Acacia pycnantha]
MCLHPKIVWPSRLLVVPKELGGLQGLEVVAIRGGQRVKDIPSSSSSPASDHRCSRVILCLLFMNKKAFGVMVEVSI